MTLFESLDQAAQFLSPSDTARLDAEVLLAAVLQVSRAYLIAHQERPLTMEEQGRYRDCLARRQKGEPIAYVLGHKEFWSLDFLVTPAVLIPRPETELLVELTLQCFPKERVCRVADLGTGSGALALSLAKERPMWEIYATDLSPEALGVAAQNARRLDMGSLRFSQGRWCQALPAVLFDAIVSNPPYLSQAEWEAGSHNLAFEPVSALVSDDNGLCDIREIVKCAKNHLNQGGYLLLEHGYDQAQRVRQLLEKEGYREVRSYRDLAGIERVTKGQV